MTGTDGFIEIGLWEPHVGISAAKGKAFKHFARLDVAVSRRPPQDSSFVEQLRHFVSAIRGEESLLLTGEEGMAAVDVVSRAYVRKNPRFPVRRLHPERAGEISFHPHTFRDISTPVVEKDF